MLNLRSEITCLHCWTRFPPEDLLWRSEHRDLLGDPLLGDDAQLCFAPTRFEANGNAIDAKGTTCRDMVCPKCHLGLPRALLEREPLFVSILGTPSCGKSFYLGALANGLRRELPAQFQLHFSDADMTGNQALSRYEEHLFLSENGESLVPLADLIPKTQLHGDLYDTVRYGEQTITYPRPFSFLLEPSPRHPNVGKSAGVKRVVCVYDNAGEHFLPGQDSLAAPGTRHLAEASFLLFLYDPTQDPRWHSLMRRLSADMQMPQTRHAGRQEQVLTEAASRVRKLRALTDGARHPSPLVVVLTKADVWDIGLPPQTDASFLQPTEYGVAAIDVPHIREISASIRGILLEHIPEIVYAAESFCTDVFYLTASALGAAPRFGEDNRASIRPRDISPKGVTLPFLLGIALTTKGLIPTTKTRASHVPS